MFVEKILGLDILEYTELKDKLQITRQKETDTFRTRNFFWLLLPAVFAGIFWFWRRMRR